MCFISMLYSYLLFFNIYYPGYVSDIHTFYRNSIYVENVAHLKTFINICLSIINIFLNIHTYVISIYMCFISMLLFLYTFYNIIYLGYGISRYTLYRNSIYVENVAHLKKIINICYLIV